MSDSAVYFLLHSKVEIQFRFHFYILVVSISRLGDETGINNGKFFSLYQLDGGGTDKKIPGGV